MCLGLIGHSRGPDGGWAKRREHGWPSLYQSENSSSTQTKLTCRCTGHVWALCGNKSHWIRGRYLSAPLNVPFLPVLSLDAKMCLSVWLAASQTADWTADWTAHADNYGKSSYFMYECCSWVFLVWSDVHLFCGKWFNPLAWSSIDALTALIILHCGTEEVEDKGEGNVYDQTVISFPWE